MPASKINNMRRKTIKKRKIKTKCRRIRNMNRIRTRYSGGIKLADKFTDQIDSKIARNLKSELIEGETCTISKSTGATAAANINCSYVSKPSRTAIRAISGEFVGKKFTGHGIFDWFNDPYYQRYEGAWANNKIHGDGVMNWTDGKKFTGTFKNDKPINGNVIYCYDITGRKTFKGELQVDAAEIGQKIMDEPPLWGGKLVIGYNGDILNGTPHSTGTVFFADNTWYEGGINEGTMQGHGKYHDDPDGDDNYYEGTFQNNEKETGQGIYETYDDPDEPDEPDEIREEIWKNGNRTFFEWYKYTNKVVKVIYVDGRLISTTEINPNSDLWELEEATKHLKSPTIKERLLEFMDSRLKQDETLETIRAAAEIQNEYKPSHPRGPLPRHVMPASRNLAYMNRQSVAINALRNISPRLSPDMPR